MISSKRPGRSRAGSTRSARFVAPRTKTSFIWRRPSISLRICAMMFLWTPEGSIIPRTVNRASISSKNTLPGALSRPWRKISFTIRSDSPTHFDRTSAMLTLKNVMSFSVAIAFARSVLPQPRGPSRRRPRAPPRGLPCEQVDDLRDHAGVVGRAALHDRVRLRVDPHVLPDRQARLVDEARGHLEELRRAGHDDLVRVQVRALLADDVRVQEGRLLDLVELVLVRLQAVLPLLDLVPEGVEVPLVLAPEAVDLLLELVPHVVRGLLRLVRIPVAHSTLPAQMPA